MIPKHFWNAIVVAIGLAISWIGTWQLSIICYCTQQVLAIPLIVLQLFTWIGYYNILRPIWNWDDEEHRKLLSQMSLGIGVMFASMAILDTLFAPFVNNIWDQWIFYIPIGVRGIRPVWQWDGTALYWGAAYVLFFLLEWIGLPVTIAGFWFWEE